MAEAEDVIVDAARRATAYAQDLLRRRRHGIPPPALTLLDAAPRLALLLAALQGRQWSLRVAQPPAPITALTRLFRRDERPRPTAAVPSANAEAIWLPRELEGVAVEHARDLYKGLVLQQAQRAATRDHAEVERLVGTLQGDVYLVLEAEAADAALARRLPGLKATLERLRAEALRRRPPLASFAVARRPLERWLRERMARQAGPAAPTSTSERIEVAAALVGSWPEQHRRGGLYKDWWIGDWPLRESWSSRDEGEGLDDRSEDDDRPVRSARLQRRPTVRQAREDEDDQRPGPTMIQTAQPHESAADPQGLQRPTDRETDEAAESHAESLSDLPQARLVRSSRPAHEVLLSDDMPAMTSGARPLPAAAGGEGIRYPEWDYRAQAYRDPGTTVWESLAEPGPGAWVERTLEEQRATLAEIRRRFEMLRGQRLILRRQVEGDDLDIEACIEARANLRAGGAMSERLYQSSRLMRRDSAVMVLVDVSGSTDAWISGGRRIIDVEREALLPLSVALDSSGDPHAILAFSGKGPQRVVVRTVKRFGERHDESVARRIAGLEPERYTRAGAALRHATRLLAEQPARHRLLLLLSDGKPNDEDDYEGRYGVEDMRRAVLEARQAGQSPFCLTVDRQAASYLPQVFGPHHYALLQRPERLHFALIDWMKRLLTS